MAFANLYNKLVKEEVNVGKNLLIPRNVYKIVSYQYVDGTLGSFNGPKSAYVFLIGITPDKVLHCLKISEVQPPKFFNWLKLNIKKGVKNEDIQKYLDESNMSEMITPDNRLGTKIFQKAKSNVIYRQQPGTYRTYLLKNVKVIKKVKFDTEEVLKILKIPNTPSETLKTEEK